MLVVVSTGDSLADVVQATGVVVLDDVIVVVEPPLSDGVVAISIVVVSLVVVVAIVHVTVVVCSVVDIVVVEEVVGVTGTTLMWEKQL